MRRVASARAQVAHNKKHGIKPESIVKQVADIMEAAYPAPEKGRVKVGETGATTIR